MQNDTLTHHFIDDQVAIDQEGIEPWDLAMDAFRRTGQFPPHRLIVDADGKTMTLYMRGSKLADNYEQMARLIILMERLPLRLKRDTFTIGNITFEDNLIITYAGR